MSAHTPTNLIRSFRCSAQEGFCAATVSRGNPALETETSYGFIYLEGQVAQRTISGQHLKTLKSFWILGLQGFALLAVRARARAPVCVCEVSITQAAQTHPSSLICASVGGGGGVRRR